MAPLQLDETVGHVLKNVFYVVTGFGFGFALERAGFGNARMLAAQFYLRDMRVLKVMFTAIVTAMLLIFWSSAMGLLDYQELFINPTHLWPGILGGMIFGVGFVVGGYCPGTALVSMATLKLDGLLFVIGLGIGMFVFGETVSWFQGFWDASGYYGEVSLQSWLGLPAGVVVLLVVVMALGMFWGAEKIEAYFAARDGEGERIMNWKAAGASLAVILGLGLLFFRQPTAQQRLERLEPGLLKKLGDRQVQIDPAELLDLIYNRNVRIKILDLRDEAEFNLFHITGAERITLDHVHDREWARSLPPQTVIVAVSNGETRATEAWKLLAAQKVLNIYLLDGGINRWLDVYGPARMMSKPSGKDEVRRYKFEAALGGRHPESGPDPEKIPKREYQTKVKGIGQKARKKGGCG